MKVVYHSAPKDMVGTTIYPLHQLREIAAQAYEFQKAKYAGREATLDFRIPDLGMLFNDTVHCAALDPRRLYEARQRLGIPLPSASARTWLTGQFFAIPWSESSSTGSCGTRARRCGSAAPPVKTSRWHRPSPSSSRSTQPSTASCPNPRKRIWSTWRE